MKTGIELIAEERQVKQIEKHGFTGEHHANHPEWYADFQLGTAACALAYEAIEEIDCYDNPPANWDVLWWNKMVEKPYKKRLIIAGAMLAAELDRLKYLNQQPNKEK